MAADQHSIFVALTFMFSILSVQYWQSLAIRPPEHSVVVMHEDDATAISPEMTVLFRGNNRTAPPAANNSTVPKRRLPARELRQKENGMRKIALVAGVVGEVVGIRLLGTAATAYVNHIRKQKPEARQRAVWTHFKSSTNNVHNSSPSSSSSVENNYNFTLPGEKIASFSIAITNIGSAV